MCAQWAAVLALSGDAADNVPGIKGIGIKTSPVLIKKYGDVEGVLARGHEETGKVVLCMPWTHGITCQQILC